MKQNVQWQWVFWSNSIRPEHPIEKEFCLYEGAVLPGQSYRAEWLRLEEITQSSFNPQTTIYTPPRIEKKLSNIFIEKFKIIES